MGWLDSLFGGARKRSGVSPAPTKVFIIRFLTPVAPLRNPGGGVATERIRTFSDGNNSRPDSPGRFTYLLTRG